MNRRQFSKTKNKQVWGKQNPEEGDEKDSLQKEIEEKKKYKKILRPNFELSGLLREDFTTSQGLSSKYQEPSGARDPTEKWQLVLFEGEEITRVYSLTQSHYILGKDRMQVDIPLEDASCEDLHAVIQFKVNQKKTKIKREQQRKIQESRIQQKKITSILTSIQNDIETQDIEAVTPYLIDLATPGGSFVNGEKIENSTYFELLSQDKIKFAQCTTEFTLLNADEINLEN
ncbi:smad nuclear-interacting protein [Anaeramoeba flamelloides]|uniref:Smad nuclear-interacting protein n=1 Tax=Anaeramoeba flamelloides TaxID=1746091 RepID=A0AAV7Y4D4_9EUKA|nr:smad nuclear-interacting protein [Anaeramoeba flamelloides]KAJ6247544.1 smad nuclear-interacting protein [Anaeramoeba flamelloides]